MYFSSCGHAIKSNNIDNLTAGTRLYEPEERACPLCKNPNNLAIPVITQYQSKVNDLSTDNSIKFKSEDLLNTLFSKNSSTILNNSTENSKQMISFMKTIEEPINCLRDNTMISALNFSDLVNMANNRFPPIQASEKQVNTIPVTQLISESIVYVVKMSKLTGLPQFILKTAPYYQNLFKNLRLMIYDEISTESNKKMYEQESLKILNELRGQLTELLNAEEFVFISYESKVIEMLMALVMNCYDELVM